MTALVNGEPAGSIVIEDHGFAYGDGVFETIRVHAGQPVWWDEHLTRMAAGAARLGLPMAAAETFRAEADSLIAQGTGSDGVLKLVLTRGIGPRSYAPPSATVPTRVVSLYPFTGVRSGDGLRMHLCTLRLAKQPALAGIKHLNRLEQVLAARECQFAGADEGLLCDSDGAAISGIAGNLFVVRDGQAATPEIIDCGIAGICRNWLLTQGSAVAVPRIRMQEIAAADELFLCNSVRGILPIVRLEQRSLPIGKITQKLQRRLAERVPAFAC